MNIYIYFFLNLDLIEHKLCMNSQVNDTDWGEPLVEIEIT
jgi:hypothetical protein